MKKKNIFILAAVVLAILVVGILIGALSSKEDDWTIQDNSADATQNSIQNTEEVPATEEELVEGLEVWDETEPAATISEDAEQETENADNGDNENDLNDETNTDNTDSTESTVPPETTEPTEAGGSSQNETTTYEKYLAMTAEEQQAFFNSFESADAFFEWYDKAKAEYEEKKEIIEIEGGNIDLGEITGDQS